jgi:hypothetical protein
MDFPQPTYFGRNRYCLLSRLLAWEAERAARGRVAAFPRSFPPRQSVGGGTLMAIHSKYLEILEAVIATALNIVKNRPLADLYVRKDMGHFRIRVQLESGQRYVITIREE